MIETWVEAGVLTFVLILMRVGAFVVALPLFGGQNVPRFVRAGLILSLTVYWFSILYPQPAVTYLGTPGASFHWVAFVIALLRELVIGAVLGFSFGMFFIPFRIAGGYLAQEMGLTLAQITDPTSNQQSTVFGQALEFFGIMLFFVLDGHHIFFATLHSSFVQRPAGGEMTPLPMETYLVALSTTQQWGLLIAAPVSACLFITSLVLALMARAAPQLNIMSIGFALRIGVGLIAVMVLLPELSSGMLKVIERYSGLMQHAM